MISIVVASKNPVKINATLSGFTKAFPDEEISIEGISVPSGVSDQPMTDEETLRGACTRASNAAIAAPHADFTVGLEGGIEKAGDEMVAFAWAAIRDKNGMIGRGKTGTFYLPPAVAALVNQGKELGVADDIVFSRMNSKQENGAVGILTKNIIDRTALYSEAMVFALIPFMHPELFANKKAASHDMAGANAQQA